MSIAPQHYYQTPGHVIAAGIALSALDIVVVAIRFAGRIRTKQRIGIDDWLLLPATVLTVGVGVCLVVGVAKEAFAHREIPTPSENPSPQALAQMSIAIKLEWSISVILNIALGCTKASFIFFYRRLFSISPKFNRFLWYMVAFIVLWTVAFFLATLLCCWIMTFAIWKPISEMVQCKVFLDILMGLCITGFVTDLVIIIIPVPLVLSLNLTPGQKLLTCGSFLLGAVTVASALARLIISVQLVEQALDPANDIILNMTLYVYWAMVEASIGVFAACLPTLQYFFRSWAGWSILARRVRSTRSSDKTSINSTTRDEASFQVIYAPGIRSPGIYDKQSKDSLLSHDQSSTSTHTLGRHVTQAGDIVYTN